MCLPQLGTISFLSLTQLCDILKLVHEIKHKKIPDSGIIFFFKEHLYKHGTLRGLELICFCILP